MMYISQKDAAKLPGRWARFVCLNNQCSHVWMAGLWSAQALLF